MPSSVTISNENTSNYSFSITDGIEVDVDIDDTDIGNENEGENIHNNCSSLCTTSSLPSKRKPSWVWSHFKKPVERKAEFVYCLLCREDVFYSRTHSTGMLERHIKRKHPGFFKEALKSGVKKVPKLDISQVSMEGFVVPCPTFEQCLLSWAVETYQPL